MRRVTLALVVAVAVAGCDLPRAPTAPSAPTADVPSREGVVAYARRYVELAWVGGPEHVFHGVDCSGLVSRSWRLPRKVSTRELAAMSVKLADARDLLPGDVLNKSNGHVLLFVTFTDATRTRARVIEAGAWDGRAWRVVESEYALEALAATPSKRREMTR